MTPQQAYPIVNQFIRAAIKWLNDNQGLVAVLIFVIGALVGGLLTFRRKPRFEFSVIAGPTFACTFATGNKFGEYEAHRTAIALYLHIANVGAAASSVRNVSVAYHWHLEPFSWQWIKYTLGWFWIKHQAIIATDFQVRIGDNVKFFPFLFQRSTVLPGNVETFLEPGRSTNGVVYFHQPESWGGCFPQPKNGTTKIKVCLEDAFGRRHTKTFEIPIVSLADAQKYNPSFGTTVLRASAADETPSAGTVADLPYGIPLSSRENLVQSPYVSRAAYIDVRSFTRGMPVQCPYTGKIFLVP